jgi:hypothetical protein
MKSTNILLTKFCCRLFDKDPFCWITLHNWIRGCSSWYFHFTPPAWRNRILGPNACGLALLFLYTIQLSLDVIEISPIFVLPPSHPLFALLGGRHLASTARDCRSSQLSQGKQRMRRREDEDRRDLNNIEWELNSIKKQ